MKVLNLNACPETRLLVEAAHGEEAPVVLLDGRDECLVAMSPACFERIVVGGERLAVEDRANLRF